MAARQKIIHQDEYKVTKPNIGCGGFSTVSLGKLNSTGEIIAIKVLTNPLTRDEEDKFWNEITLLDSIDHPACLKLVGYDLQPLDESHGPTIITPYMKYTLAGILDNDIIFTPTRQSIIIYGIARALRFLHQHNIIHRDLKPDNVFLTTKYEPVLADFGLSRSYSSSNFNMSPKAGMIFITAPEVSTGVYTNRADIFSFGMLLVQLYNDDSNPDDFHLDDEADNGYPTQKDFHNRIKKGARPPKPNKMPISLYQLAQKCWILEPSQRISSEAICELFETKQIVIEGTNEEEFLKYKAYIDEGERLSTTTIPHKIHNSIHLNKDNFKKPEEKPQDQPNLSQFFRTTAKH